MLKQETSDSKTLKYNLWNKQNAVKQVANKPPIWPQVFSIKSILNKGQLYFAPWFIFVLNMCASIEDLLCSVTVQQLYNLKIFNVNTSKILIQQQNLHNTSR